MKYKLRIGEFARLKNVTTETLRHYDRVDLLKPIEIDVETGYRYYSVFQSEKLASIIELKALGFSIEEMKAFFDDRNLTNTYALLKDQRENLRLKIKAMNRLEKSLSGKLRRLEKMMELESSDRYIVRIEKTCPIAYMESIVEDMASFEWHASDLENQLVKINPVVGSDAYGVIISKESFCKGKFMEQSHVIYFLEDTRDVDKSLIRHLPDRKVACFMVRGERQNFEPYILNMIKELADDGLEITGDIVVRFRVGGTSTDVESEYLHEFQIPIK
jgi:DNA-binding transcriptional MerR regulator